MSCVVFRHLKISVVAGVKASGLNMDFASFFPNRNCRDFSSHMIVMGVFFQFGRDRLSVIGELLVMFLRRRLEDGDVGLYRLFLERERLRDRFFFRSMVRERVRERDFFRVPGGSNVIEFCLLSELGLDNVRRRDRRLDRDLLLRGILY
jgi:hypothetical protein